MKTYLITGNEPEVFSSLADPRVLGAVWLNPFSAESMTCAQSLALAPKMNRPRQREVKLKALLQKEETYESLVLQEDLTMTERLFKSLGAQLLKNGEPGVYDSCRVEPALGDATAIRNGDWHVDSTKLIALSVLSGWTTQCLKHHVKGTFDNTSNFYSRRHPDDNMIYTIPNNALLIMKGSSFPNIRNDLRGLLHRRPNAQLEQADQNARVIIHLMI